MEGLLDMNKSDNKQKFSQNKKRSATETMPTATPSISGPASTGQPPSMPSASDKISGRSGEYFFREL